MKKLMFVSAVVLAMVLCVANAYAHKETRAMKKGILLVAFGTSEASAKVSFQHIEKKVKKTFPGVDVVWAYTSHIIRHKLAGEGEVVPSPAQALAHMMDKGYTHVAVQSLHTIPGEEYHDLVRTVNSFRAMPGGFDRLIPGFPMLGTQETVARAVDAVIATLPGARKATEPVVLMGHGTHHPGNIYYSAMNWQLQQKDPNIIVGTVEGYPGLGDVIAWLETRKAKTVWLMPFMSVAGDHAKNDMAGNEEDSWKSRLTRAGFSCRTVLKGTAEYDEFVAIWMAQLAKVMNHFK